MGDAEVARTLAALTMDSPDTEVIPPATEWWKDSEWNPADPVAVAEMAEIKRQQAELARQAAVHQKKLDDLRARNSRKRKPRKSPTAGRRRRLAQRIRERGDNYRVQA